MLSNSDKYPSTLAYGYVWNYLNTKGVTEEDIGKLAMGLHNKLTLHLRRILPYLHP